MPNPETETSHIAIDRPASSTETAAAVEQPQPAIASEQPAMIADDEFQRILETLGVTEEELLAAQQSAERQMRAPAATGPFEQAVALAQEHYPHAVSSLAEDWRSFAIAALGSQSAADKSHYAVADMADHMLLHFVQRQARLQSSP
jgi:hypothetical protein